MLSLECIVIVLFGLFIPSIGHVAESAKISKELKKNGGQAFIATIARPNKFSAVFVGMPGTEETRRERVKYVQLLDANGFTNTAAIVQERVENSMSWRDLLEEFDRRNREGRALPFACNVVQDPLKEMNGRSEPSTLASSSRYSPGKTMMTRQEPSKVGIPELERFIKAGEFDCRTLAEWSYQQLECDKAHDCSVTDSRRELAFRLMAELGSSNLFPKEVLGRPAVFLYLAQFSISRGDVITAAHLVSLSWEAASAGESLGFNERGEFFRTLESLRDKLKRRIGE